MPGIVRVDVSNAIGVLDRLKSGAAASKRAIQNRLTKFSSSLADELNQAAPEQNPARLDPRHPIKLKGSFDSIRSGDTRIVVTQAPQKLSWVTLGTAAHVIRPLFKKALWWPGLQRPVALVNHPGTQPNDFVQRVLEAHDMGDEAQAMADAMLDIIMGTAGYPSMSQPMDFEGAEGGWKNYI